MKTIYYIVLLVIGNLNAQIIDIPDANFKAGLIANGVDVNSNGDIEQGEAISTTVLWLQDLNITSLSGIENFINLYALYCDNNQLTNINISTLPNLSQLQCTNNQITSINTSQNVNLEYFNCAGNQIYSLNLSQNLNLSNLQCGANELSFLNLDGLVNLMGVISSNNNITNISLTGCLNLNILDLNYNQLSSIDLLPVPNLKSFGISFNPISQLDITNLVLVESLNFGSTPITTIDLSNNIFLEQLDTRYSQINSLDLSNCPNLTDLFCNSDYLTSLLIKNGNSENNLYFAPSSNLNYICADEEQLIAVQNQIDAWSMSICNANSYCTFTPGGTTYIIQGNHRYDVEGNGCASNDDVLVPFMKYNITSGTETGTIISNSSGQYSIAVNDGFYIITPIIENSLYYNIDPANATVTFPFDNTPSINDFCISQNGNNADVEIVIIPLENVRPGYDAKYKIICRNIGNAIQYGSVNITYNGAVLQFVNASPNSNSQSGNTITWNYADFQPLQSLEILLTLHANTPTDIPPLALGDEITLVGVITGLGPDLYPLNNNFSLTQTIVDSLDPNKKICIEGDEIGAEMVGEYVHYIIRFENTGTANAQNIVVKDMIDMTKFQISTLVPLHGSHSFVTRITETNKVEFIFENINLPFDDANNDGYVAFKIKTNPTLVLGDSFSNTASIYFDYNFPIVTDPAVTTVAILNTKDFEFSDYFAVYPNPVNEVLHIQSKQNTQINSISIYNTVGQLLIVIPNTQNISTVDLSNLAAGNYFIKINSDLGDSVARFLKE